MDYAAIEWREGLPYSKAFDDVYFSSNDGRGESEHVFIEQNDLRARFAKAERFTVAEIGFGTGLNFALALKLWLECASANAQLDYFAVESAPMSPDNIRRVAAIWPDLDDYFEAFLTDYPLPVAGRHLCCLCNGRVRLHLAYMDVCDALESETLGVNAWFLDGFSPAKNLQVWNQEVYTLIAQNSAPDATLATYSVAGAARRGLVEAGFRIEKQPGHGRKREILFAELTGATAYSPAVEPWFRGSPFEYKTKQAVIVGAGLAGLSVAWSLIQRGWTVTVVDRYPDVAGGASGNPAGLVMPRLSVDDTIEAQFYAVAFLHAVSRLNDLQAEYRSCTGKQLWKPEGVYCAMESQRVRQLLERNQFHDDYLCAAEQAPVSLQMMPGEDLLYLARAGWASPHLICQAINIICENKINYVNANIASIHQSGNSDGNWQLINDEQKVMLEADVLVLANGVNATQFAQTEWLPVHSVRGQLTRLEVRDDAMMPMLAYSAGHYLAPSLDNERVYYCGASYHVGDDCMTMRYSDQKENMDFAESSLPGVFSQTDTQEGRVGFRTVSDDRLPIVGQLPDSNWYKSSYEDLKHGRSFSKYESAKHLAGLYVTAAHGSRGMTSCFLSGEVIASQIEGSVAPVGQAMLSALNPARFIIRRLKRGA